MFLVPSLVSFVESGLDKVGKTSVGVRKISLSELELQEPKQNLDVITAASLRLDALLSVALRISRSKISSMISSGQVKVNHVPLFRSDHRLEEGDIISIHGLGRIRIHEIAGETRKERIRVVIDRYRKKE